MEKNGLPVLLNHKLTYLKELRVSKDIFSEKFSKTCSMVNCDASCCREGVMADLKDRDKILDHTELIQRYMEPHQEKDPSKWFDPYDEVDMDFPSGRAIGTQASEDGCVFLNSKGYCVLQIASTENGMGKYSLKPFFCFTYPVTLDRGVLDLEDSIFTNRKECCSRDRDGRISVLELCEEELEFMLGVEGFEELKAISRK